MRLTKIGPVIDAGSFKHKLLHLLCNYVISSQVSTAYVNPFDGYHDAYRDILNEHHFVFLQHGVIKDDLSGWLKKYSKNLYGFVTSAIPEYKSIVNGNYFYTEQEVWLTGLPRFDRLHDKKDRCITIMPTWREYLMASTDGRSGIWRLKDGFIESSYFQFYNQLLNDRRLHEASAKYGYLIQFLPHPTLREHINVFSQNEWVRFVEMDETYRDIFAQSSLVVSDYSSAVFDFAYLRKPIIYCHFDFERFFAGDHVYTKGYFDYERDGFGEVEYDLEQTVDRIIEYMENGCQLKDKFRKRIDEFFAFNDRNNCQRVYEKIVKLNK